MSHLGTRRWMLLLGAGLVILLGWGTLSRATQLGRGQTVSLRGTTSAARPELAELVLRDRLIDFEIRNAAGDLIYKGKLQDRVVKSGVDGTLSFYLFIRNTQQDLPGAITSVTRGNFANFQTDVEFRVDGLGHIGPKEANRSSDGENITFDFEKEPVHSGNDSRFFFILTDTTEYAPESGSTILRTTDGSSVRLATSAPLSVPRPRSAVASKNADSGPKADALRPHEAEGSRESPADYTLWTSAFGFIAPAHSALSIERGFSGNTIRITSSRVGDLQWIDLPLSIPSNVSIQKVIVCYQLSNARSFISQVRLSEEREPPGAVVRHDDGTDLKSTTAVCYESHVKSLKPKGAITLSLRLNFMDSADHIDIGAIGLLLRP
jgi:hypothetical protein